MDQLEYEQKLGMTCECGFAVYETETKIINMIDVPGHQFLTAKAIEGASQAEIAVLVVSARKGEFEVSFQRDGQIREHIIIARTIGVQTLIVAVNKMDEDGKIQIAIGFQFLDSMEIIQLRNNRATTQIGTKVLLYLALQKIFILQKE
ncbi:MAG: putative elongation factor Tu GTP binding domain protein [Streblomastix strix]|uniref:Putative elongation factor Tu GTP binding domain protein n=1 Tax=Streblomastix strix TaxID=222440 RepID=A0A5J4UY04_9EUKA|nr:MAG: putative elongation factor Tu GTP binding domain protein [Streblomastix strix]